MVIDNSASKRTTRIMIYKGMVYKSKYWIFEKKIRVYQCPSEGIFKGIF